VSDGTTLRGSIPYRRNDHYRRAWLDRLQAKGEGSHTDVAADEATSIRESDTNADHSSERQWRVRDVDSGSAGSVLGGTVTITIAARVLGIPRSSLHSAVTRAIVPSSAIDGVRSPLVNLDDVRRWNVWRPKGVPRTYVPVVLRQRDSRVNPRVSCCSGAGYVYRPMPQNTYTPCPVCRHIDE
jgi:hypothetical protein